MSSPNNPSKCGTASSKSVGNSNSPSRTGNSSHASHSNNPSKSSGGAKYRTIKDSPYKGTISKQDARSAAKSVKNQRSTSK